MMCASRFAPSPPLKIGAQSRFRPRWAFGSGSRKAARFASDGMARLLGIEEPQQAARLSDYVQHVHPDDRPLLTLTLVNFVVGGGKCVSRHRMLHRDGGQRRFLSRSVVVLPEHGHPAHVVVADFDLTGPSCSINEMRHRLCCLGWKSFDRGRQTADGRWWVFAQSCGHTVVALAHTRKEAWSAACPTALKCTRHGWVHFVDDPRR